MAKEGLIKHLEGFMLVLYLKLIRSWVSPLIYWVFRFTKYRGIELPKVWFRVKEYRMEDFESLLLACPYKRDLLCHSPQEPDFFFFEPRKRNRGCDDWARMWYWWGLENGYEAYEIAIYDQLFRNGHMFTVLKKPNIGNRSVYKLMDYEYCGTFFTLEDTINRVKRQYGYRKPFWAINKNS